MARSTHCACTSVLVGRAATLDGSTLIARTEDNTNACAPKCFCVRPAKRQRHQNGCFTSAGNGFTMELFGAARRYTATPEADPSEGLYEEAGINDAGVAMSATESTYANERVLAHDPLVEEGGLAEDALLTVVLPYIASAREGVRRVGDIVAAHGSAESNSLLFADVNEVWYMELATGHHWVAQRIPDDAYAVCANRISIQQVNFSSDDFMASDGIQEFVEAHRLNPHPDTFDFRRIFGTYTQQDAHYNAPRTWYGQRLLGASDQVAAACGPEDLDQPFIRRANRLLGVDDVARLLSSHYEGTPFDPLGADGDEHTRTRYRAVSLSRTQEGHILQLRPHVPAERAAIHWVALGTPTFSPFVPFFANASAAHPAWEHTPARPEANSAYWMARTLGMLAESRWPQMARAMDDFLTAWRQKAHAHVAATDCATKELTGEELTAALTQANHAYMDTLYAGMRTLVQDLLMAAAEDSRLSFAMDANL